jgi:hypothetical protein
MADVLYLLHYSWPILKATVVNAFEGIVTFRRRLAE